jgi:hypothetical protein
VAFQNVGPNDVVLDLGYMVGSGKEQHPTAIRLILTDPRGQVTVLRNDSGYKSVIMGPVYDLPVGLPTGATFILPVNLDQYCCFEPDNHDSKVPAGHYRIMAVFEAPRASFATDRPPCIPMANCWNGATQSNTIEYEVAVQPH